MARFSQKEAREMSTKLRLLQVDSEAALELLEDILVIHPELGCETFDPPFRIGTSNYEWPVYHKFKRWDIRLAAEKLRADEREREREKRVASAMTNIGFSGVSEND